MDSKKPSLFELEALRMRDLNKEKAKADSSLLESFVTFIFGFLFGSAFLFGLLIPLLFYHVLACGFVAKVLWHWFVTPTFHVADLTLIQACGIMLFVRLLTCPAKYESTDTDAAKSEWAIKITYAMLAPWGMLLLGYVIHHFQ